MEGNEVMSDEILDTLEANAMEECYVSLNALSGSSKPGTIQFRALVGNQVMLLLLDLGSSRSFVDQNLVDKLNCNVSEMEHSK